MSIHQLSSTTEKEVNVRMKWIYLACLLVGAADRLYALRVIRWMCRKRHCLLPDIRPVLLLQYSEISRQPQLGQIELEETVDPLRLRRSQHGLRLHHG